MARVVPSPPRSSERSLQGAVDRLERICHHPLRSELQAIVTLSEEALPRHVARHPALFPDAHLAMCRLQRAVAAFLDEEEALLFPSIRFLERGLVRDALDLRPLVVDLIRAHVRILTLLATLRAETRGYRAPAMSPMLNTLFGALREIDRGLQAYFEFERRDLFPRAIALSDVKVAS
jgi:iron-sulfur cluster repair protein YtfE (RIC family)